MGKRLEGVKFRMVDHHSRPTGFLWSFKLDKGLLE